MKIFYIMSFIFLFAVDAKSQSRLNTGSTIIMAKPYPNPASSKITFNFENGYNKNFSFQIFNFIGKKVYDLPALTQKTTVDVTDLYRGVYIFQVRDQTGRIIESGKFQVAR
ncbi:MAG: T9SS type A sorting domain-containing protein [Chitinophagaceae bacterium]